MTIHSITTLVHKFEREEHGFVVSAELLLILTLMICGVAVGFATVKDAIATELNDVSDAIGAVDQSYNVTSYQAPTNQAGVFHGSCGAFGFNDADDVCDGQPILVIAAGGGGESQ